MSQKSTSVLIDNTGNPPHVYAMKHHEFMLLYGNCSGTARVTIHLIENPDDGDSLTIRFDSSIAAFVNATGVFVQAPPGTSVLASGSTQNPIDDSNGVASGIGGGAGGGYPATLNEATLVYRRAMNAWVLHDVLAY